MLQRNDEKEMLKEKSYYEIVNKKMWR